jgi:ornithine cyclodeaminase/alanine dehydrogenase-like protein (mu-crystallin family)
VDGQGGEFHVKAGGLTVGDRTYFGLKANGGFFGNPARGLPAIQGIIYLADASDGAPLAILDSIHITVQLTGAATAIAAKYLARPDARRVTIAERDDRLASSSPRWRPCSPFSKPTSGTGGCPPPLRSPRR